MTKRTIGTSQEVFDAHIRRLAILGEMLAETVHEINNLMLGVLGYTDLEIHRRERAGEETENLRHILECGTGIRGLARSLLSLARPPDLQANGDAADAVRFVLDLLGRRALDVSIDSKIPADLPPVALSAGDLRLVLANLVKNALDALLGSPSPEIRIRARREPPSRVTLEIWNSGPPIADALLPRLFTPYVTTKEEGTGLGLAISRRIVAEAGGSLRAENPDSGGVAFRVTLPVAAARLIGAEIEGKTPSPRLSGRRVLVVDDDSTAREVFRLIVSEMGGARVHTCSSGEQALEVLGHESFDAVLLDLRMAGLSGQQVYRVLPRSLKRRVVFVTGDTAASGAKRFLASTRQPALFKPVESRELLDAVHKVAAA